MDSNKKTARIAGLFYFLFLLFGGFAQIVRSNLIIEGNALVTIGNLQTHAMIFRAGMVTDLIGSTVYIFLALFLYRLLKPVNKNIAVLMVVLVLAGIPIAMLNQLNLFASALLLSGPDYLKSFSPDQLNALALLFIDLNKQGVYIADIFWGLWLFPFGYLVFKSGFLPKAIGILLMIGCFGFLIEFIVLFLFPKYPVITYPGLAVSTIAEFSAIFWLLVFGAKDQPIDGRKN